MSGLISWAMGLPYSDDGELRAIPADQKVRIIQAMGFTPVGDSHHWDCPYARDAGYLCNCVQPETVWQQPADVAAFRHETYKERWAIPLSARRIPDVER